MIENNPKKEIINPVNQPEQQDSDKSNRGEGDSSGRSLRKNFRGSNTRRPDKRKFFLKKKVCFFCKNKESKIDYKDVNLMRRFVAESGKITPRRFSGTCARHQRKLSTEIKKARQMALIPYTDR